ncbi:MAG: sulfate reduction electron transfer complex DsrMKJOP subunit DsrJ [Dissulfuribacterales bacterium]
MYDLNKILVGLAIFLLFFTFPILYGMGSAVPVPKPKLDTPEIQKLIDKKCVEDTHFMKTSHMQFLNYWRDKAVRDDQRVYNSKLNGKKYDISLQNTCMKCHSNKKEFCDSCHTYASVKPYCWDCHIEPKAAKESM